MSDSEVYFWYARTGRVYPASAAVTVLRAVNSIVYSLNGIVVYQAERRARIDDCGVVPAPVRPPIYRVRRRSNLPEASRSVQGIQSQVS